MQEAIYQFFIDNRIKFDYFQYLQADPAVFWRQVSEAIARKPANDSGILFDYAYNTMRSDYLHTPYYKVKTCIPDNFHSLQSFTETATDSLQTGITELELDFQVKALVTEFLRCGWQQIGISLKMILKAKYFPGNHQAHGYHFREANNEDYGALNEIIGYYRGNPLFDSPYLKQSDTSALFSAWVEYSQKKLNSQLYVLEHNGEVLGFTNAMSAPGFSKKIGKELGIIDFIMVHPNHHHRGIAQILLQESIGTFFREMDYIELKTSLQNLSAVNFYIQNQFKITERSFVLQHQKR